MIETADLVPIHSRSGGPGKFAGYYFFRADHIKLKILTYTMHKGTMKNILAKVK
jgi:hypothetical protein